MKTKRIVRVIILILIVVNYILLLLRWLNWLLDKQYGCGYLIRSELKRGSKYGYEAIAEIYDGITFDFLYFAVFTTLLSICLIILGIIKINEIVEKESDKDNKLVSK
jgi:hypothetical protein